MTILFFRVEEVLNDENTEAIAPNGERGISNERVKKLKINLDEMGPGAQLVLYGEWAKDWNFDDEKCTPNGKYLIKKLDRRGLHIMDKIEAQQDPIMEYLKTHHVDHYTVLA